MARDVEGISDQAIVCVFLRGSDKCTLGDRVPAWVILVSKLEHKAEISVIIHHGKYLPPDFLDDDSWAHRTRPVLSL